MISGRLAATYPENAGREAYVEPLNIGPAQRLGSLFSVLLGLTGLVTLIVCSNVANLLMLRGAARRYEIGVCLALGCGRGRIIGQLLCESMLLAGAGAILGVIVAQSGQQLLPGADAAVAAADRAARGASNVRILAFGVLLAAAMVPIFGLLPAIHAFRGAVMPSLRLARGGAGRASARLRSALVVAQLALSLTALVSAGLFLRSLTTILPRSIAASAAPEAVLLVSTDFDQAGYRSPEQRVVAVDRLLSGIRALPGVAVGHGRDVRSAGVQRLPIGERFSVPGYVPAENESMAILSNRIAGGYFETLGIQVLQGRAIDERDKADTAQVVVVNQAFVQRFLAGRDPIGLTIDAGSGPATVIGVAANGKYRFDRLEESSPPHVYLPYAQQTARVDHGARPFERPAGRPRAGAPAGVRVRQPGPAADRRDDARRVHVAADVSGAAGHDDSVVARPGRAAAGRHGVVRRDGLSRRATLEGAGAPDGARRLAVRDVRARVPRRRSTDGLRHRRGAGAVRRGRAPDCHAVAAAGRAGRAGACDGDRHPRGDRACRRAAAGRQGLEGRSRARAARGVVATVVA